jgi:hypothetical protein
MLLGARPLHRQCSESLRNQGLKSVSATLAPGKLCLQRELQSGNL